MSSPRKRPPHQCFRGEEKYQTTMAAKMLNSTMAMANLISKALQLGSFRGSAFAGLRLPAPPGCLLSPILHWTMGVQLAPERPHLLDFQQV
jgi:hypothetical protein